MEGHMDQLNTMISNYYENMRLPWTDYFTAVISVQKLEREIQEVFPGARLNIGGSLCNGFATRESDLDLIFRLAEEERPQIYSDWSLLQQLSDVLKNLGFQTELINAKVRIVKCAPSKKINRSIDICYNNTLAPYNVRLMAKYCDWDPRLPVLGLWVKKWAKECGIGDASSGTLSSYAWVITLIHYLQNCSPPVLPRLQEDFRTSKTQREIVESHGECDVYFHKNVELNWSQNTQSVAELFLGFLDYLLEFDFSQKVIQIRQKTPVTKGEKSWRTTLCIEDPFLLSHNLAGRNKRVIARIWETIRKTKEKFMETTNFDEEILLRRCKFQGDSKHLLWCIDCGKKCKKNCPNQYIKRLKWKPEGKPRQIASAQPSNPSRMLLPSLPNVQQYTRLEAQKNPEVPLFTKEDFPEL